MYVYEHHLVYWQNTGYILKPGEELHHKNNKKHENYFENLRLTTKPLHSKEHGRYKSAILVKLRCPSCNKIFFRRQGMTHLIKSSSAEATCCSRKCGCKWVAIKRNNKDLAKFRKSNNVVEVFTTNSYWEAKMEIPKYDECRLKEPEERTPLDNFVLYYAPTGREGLFAKNLIKLLEWVASQSGVENDRSSNCSVCGKELKLICKKCATPPVSTTAAV